MLNNILPTPARKNIVTMLLTLIAVSATAEVKWVDVTANYLSNPSFDHQNTSDWTISGEASSLGAISFSCMEMWNGYIRLEHRESGVPNGHYRLSVQALYRTRKHERAYEEHVNGTEVLSAYMFANTQQQAVKSEYDFWFDHSPGRSYTPDNEHYYANSMETAQMAFSQGAYKNEMEFDVTDGTLVFGLYNDRGQKHSDNWLIFDTFRLEQQVETIDPAEGSLCFNELMAANVDMMMSPAFKLDCEGGTILLTNAKGQRFCSLPTANGPT